MPGQPLTLAVQKRLREYVDRFSKLSPAEQEAELKAQIDRLRDNEIERACALETPLSGRS